MSSLRKFAYVTLAAPMALALAACNGDAAGGDESVIAEGEPIAAIAAPDGQAWVDMAAETPEGGFVIGNPDAPIKLVEYASHTCGACAGFAAQATEPLKEKYISTGVVSFEVRNLIRDGLDLTIAQLARCGDAASFQPLADQAWAGLGDIINNANQNGAAMQAAEQADEAARYVQIAEASGLFDFFAARGISKDQATACLSDPAKATAIFERSRTQADELGINATPTFLINGKNIGNQNWESLEPILQRAGAR